MSVLKMMAFGLGALALTAASVAWSADLAQVNGKTITDKDLHEALSGFNEGQKANLLKDAASRRQVLSTLIDQELLVDEATKSKLDQDPEYKAAMEVFRKQYLASRVLQKNLSTKLTERDVKKFYENHKQRYSTDQVHAMHILVSDEERAKEVLKEAKAPGTDFQALAEKYSRDPSAKNNRGDLGYFGRERMVPEFTDAAFAGAPGEVVGPVKTAYGYHIIKIVDKKVGNALDFADVEGRVRNDLQMELTRNYVGKLRQTAKVKVNDSVIDKM